MVYISDVPALCAASPEPSLLAHTMKGVDKGSGQN